jgi:hypothetical protein
LSYYDNQAFNFTFLILAPAYAQKEAAIWYFGDGAGLDFNSGSPVTLTNGSLNTSEGCASISDKTEIYFLYRWLNSVYNKSHQIMTNGFGLLGIDLYTISAIIVPKPRNLYLLYFYSRPNHLLKTLMVPSTGTILLQIMV